MDQQLKLNLEMDGEQFNLATTSVSTEITVWISKLRKKVFIFDSSRADEIYFKQRIIDYLLNKDAAFRDKTLTDVLWDATWIRNDSGKYCKYLYFNEHRQKLRLDKYFLEWAKLMCQVLNEALEKFNDLDTD